MRPNGGQLFYVGIIFVLRLRKSVPDDLAASVVTVVTSSAVRNKRGSWCICYRAAEQTRVVLAKQSVNSYFHQTAYDCDLAPCCVCGE